MSSLPGIRLWRGLDKNFPQVASNGYDYREASGLLIGVNHGASVRVREKLVPHGMVEPHCANILNSALRKLREERGTPFC